MWRVCKHLEVAETFLMIDGRQGWPWNEGTMFAEAPTERAKKPCTTDSTTTNRNLI
jgi:hypothetical protein